MRQADLGNPHLRMLWQLRAASLIANRSANNHAQNLSVEHSSDNRRTVQGIGGKKLLK